MEKNNDEIEIRYQKDKDSRETGVKHITSPEKITRDWVLQTLKKHAPKTLASDLGVVKVSELAVGVMGPRGKIETLHADDELEEVEGKKVIVVTAPCRLCKDGDSNAGSFSPNRAIGGRVQDSGHWDLCDKHRDAVTQAARNETFKKVHSNQPILPLRSILIMSRYDEMSKNNDMVQNWYTAIESITDPTDNNYWTPKLGNLKMDQMKWKNMKVYKDSDVQAEFPLSPLSCDSKNRIRLIMGLESSYDAISGLVQQSITAWEKVAKESEIRPIYLVWLCGHGGPTGLISDLTISSGGNKKETVSTLASCEELLRAVAAGLKFKKLKGIRPVVFFDWCNSLQSSNTKKFGDWWESSDIFKKTLKNVSILGWTGSSSMVEGANELAWIGKYDDILSDTALRNLSSGAVSPIRRISVDDGVVKSDVFGVGN